MSLDIPEHQVTALIGPSGCGKSTFLRCLNRMNDTIEGCRTEGDIRLDGEDIYDRSIDPVQFGVVMTLASMIGLLTPPVGMCLYAVSSITGLSIGELTREMWPYLLGIFLVLLAVAFIPSISLWLPNLFMGM